VLYADMGGLSRLIESVLLISYLPNGIFAQLLNRGSDSNRSAPAILDSQSKLVTVLLKPFASCVTLLEPSALYTSLCNPLAVCSTVLSLAPCLSTFSSVLCNDF